MRAAYARMVLCPNAKTPTTTSNAPMEAALIGASADHGTLSIAKKKNLMSMMSFHLLKLIKNIMVIKNVMVIKNIMKIQKY